VIFFHDGWLLGLHLLGAGALVLGVSVVCGSWWMELVLNNI